MFGYRPAHPLNLNRPNQIAIGYYRSFAENRYEFSSEAYYRKMYNVIDYRDNADLFLNPHVETQVFSGPRAILRSGILYGGKKTVP